MPQIVLTISMFRLVIAADAISSSGRPWEVTIQMPWQWSST